MSPRVPISTFLHFSRLSYAVVAETSYLPASVSVKPAAKGEACGGTAVEEEIFWMRDPKTGCWIPENRFSEVDVAELRNRLLNPKK